VAPRVTWLGQAGFLFEARGIRVLVDPFLSDHEARVYPPPPVDEVGTGCDWVFVTHEHLDHLDRDGLPGIADRSPGLRAAAPAPIADEVRAVLPDTDVVAVDRGDVVDLGDAGSARVVPAVHALTPADGYSDDPRFVGYVFELDGVSIYHAGDTLVTDALLEGLRDVPVDIALVPVNGRTYFRERMDLAGNSDARDAVALAEQLGASVLVPIHWDLFAQNSERPGAAADEAWAAGAVLHVLVLRRLVPWIAAVDG
jgi:L-ascorbate metabolism protein UlaG (beta-lactamase superfamily)